MGNKKKRVTGNRLVIGKNGPELKLDTGHKEHKVFVARLDDQGKEKKGSKFVSQAALTGECWSVQFWGTDACKECPARGTRDCGGQQILKTGKNEKGFKVGKTGLEAK